jgi:hypothetical protein
VRTTRNEEIQNDNYHRHFLAGTSLDAQAVAPLLVVLHAVIPAAPGPAEWEGYAMTNANKLASAEWSRGIACQDHAGRQRHADVFLTQQGNVAFHVPPGEVAVFKPGQIPEIQKALYDARSEALARRTTP